MKPPLPRILSDVPRTLHARLEVAKAIRMLMAPAEDEHHWYEAKASTDLPEQEQNPEIFRDAFRNFLKAGFDPDEPRVPAGNPEGGQWTRTQTNGARNDSRVISDAAPDSFWRPGSQYAASIPPGIGHNQGPPLEEPPKPPGPEATTAQQIWALARTAARWLSIATVEAAEPPIGDILLAVQLGTTLVYLLQSALRHVGIGPGPFAGESVPAHGPDRNFTAAERAEINRIGAETGCHTCGTRDPGTPSGNFVLDHQPSSALNPNGLDQDLYPHCARCSARQGWWVQFLKNWRWP